MVSRNFVVPDECGTLADLIFKGFEARVCHGETVAGLKMDLAECVAFLDDVPDDTLVADLDIVSEFMWNEKALAIIKNATTKKRAKKTVKKTAKRSSR